MPDPVYAQKFHSAPIRAVVHSGYPSPVCGRIFTSQRMGLAGGGGCLSPALKLGPTSPAPRVRWSIRGDPPTLVRRILTSSTSRSRQQRALHPAAACSVGALAVLRLPPWRRGGITWRRSED